MKNYYKILQVDKDASPEIIKVAYKLLVKKNHPDLREGEDKKNAEEIIKEINEAYDILSNPIKKAEYDQTLINENISQEQYNYILNENMNLKRELNYFHNLYNRNNYYKQKNTNMYNESNYNINQNTSNDEINNNSKFKTIFNNLNENIKTLTAIIITFLIIFLVIKIPFLYDFIFDIFSNGSLLLLIIVVVLYIYYFRNKKWVVRKDHFLINVFK